VVGADGKWLSIGEVVDRFRAAGYSEHEQTIRRIIDTLIAAGKLEHYRTEVGRYRRLLTTDIDAYLQIKDMEPGPEREARWDELRRSLRGDATPTGD
jgi:hypothetical protein